MRAFKFLAVFTACLSGHETYFVFDMFGAIQNVTMLCLILVALSLYMAAKNRIVIASAFGAGLLIPILVAVAREPIRNDESLVARRDFDFFADAIEKSGCIELERITSISLIVDPYSDTGSGYQISFLKNTCRVRSVGPDGSFSGNELTFSQLRRAPQALAKSGSIIQWVASLFVTENGDLLLHCTDKTCLRPKQ